MAGQQTPETVHIGIAVAVERIAFGRIALVQIAHPRQLHQAGGIGLTQRPIALHGAGIDVGHIGEIVATVGHLAHHERQQVVPE